MGSFTLPKGAVEDFATSAGKAWEKALRRVDVDTGEADAMMASPGLKGRAEDAEEDLVGWIMK
jgi:hypothetical protein